MEFEQVITGRRSIRKYKHDPVPENVIHEIIELAVKYAPSARNMQPWRFIVVSDQELKKRVVTCCKRNTYMLYAQYIIVGLAHQEECYRVIGDYLPSDMMDLSIVFHTLILAAANKGLATCWIGAYDAEELHKVLGVTYPWRVLALTPIGYPDETGVYTERKPLEDTVEWKR